MYIEYKSNEVQLRQVASCSITTRQVRGTCEIQIISFLQSHIRRILLLDLDVARSHIVPIFLASQASTRYICQISSSSRGHHTISLTQMGGPYQMVRNIAKKILASPKFSKSSIYRLFLFGPFPPFFRGNI